MTWGRFLRLGDRSWALPLAVFLASLAIYVPTISTTVNTDVAANSLTAWRLAQTGEPWMEGLDLRESGIVIHYGPGADGHTVTTRTPGQIWAATPFYLGSSREQADFTYVRSGIAAATLTAGAVAFVFMALRRWLSLRVALGTTAVLAFATPFWSVSASSLWTHPVTLFGIAGAGWSLSRDRWWTAGAFFGFAILGRPHIALLAAVVGLGIAWSRRSPGVAARVGLASSAGVVLLAVWNRYVFGAWDLRSGYGQTYDRVVPGVAEAGPYLENLAGFLASPDRGFFIWTPLALLLLPAVVRAWSDTPAWARWLAIGGLIYSAAQLELNVFHGGDAFYGYRLGLELLVCLTPLFGFSLHRIGDLGRKLSPVVVGVQFAAIALGSIIEGLWVVDDNVWIDNSLLMALRQQPLITVVFLVAFGALGIFAARSAMSVSRNTGNETIGPVSGQQPRSSAPIAP